MKVETGFSSFAGRFQFRRIQRSFESPRYLLKWLILSTMIGIVAGIGAIAFYAAIHFTTAMLLGKIVGYAPPNPAGEGATTVTAFWSSLRPWLLPVVTTMGGLVSGIIVFSLAPEAEGHGTDAAINAFHNGKTIRARIPLIKLVASAITIGSGGSAGREGPAAQISAGFGSLIGEVLHLNAQDRRIALATGVGSGIGAIFSAPLGGAILAAEILYKDDLEVEALIPALIASIVGYSIFGAWSGWHPMFATPVDLAFSSPVQLLYYVVLGLICGGIGILYARGFYGITHIFHHIPIPRWVKPGIGGLLVGLIGLVIPQAIGMGYGWVQVSMSPQGLLSIPLWIVLLLPFVKIMTTGFSIGSGGSGGIFGPGMVIGGIAGAALWRICYHVFPGVPNIPAPFVIIGMMALFGGIAHAPLAVMLMVAEMTGNLSMLAPAMIAVGISTMIVGQNTIYESQVSTRADSPAHRFQLSFPLLSTLTVRQAMIALTVSFTPQQTVAEAEQALANQTVSGAPVLDEQGNLLGVLTRTDIQRLSEEERTQHRVREIMNNEVHTLQLDETLDEALETLTQHRISWAPVVASEALSAEKSVIGTISASDIIRYYRSTLAKDTRRMRGMVDGTVMVEIQMTAQSPLVGVSLHEAPLPKESLVISIRRQGELQFPGGDSIIEPGDLVTFLVSPRGEEQLQQFLMGQKEVEPAVS
ncbi:MAG TPA: chloride channel protein [Dictyobacter sp.]|jgi:CIC family chloride channel protein|nr:chloride channel protein [Dictyobacter sp.]